MQILNRWLQWISSWISRSGRRPETRRADVYPRLYDSRLETRKLLNGMAVFALDDFGELTVSAGDSAGDGLADHFSIDAVEVDGRDVLRVSVNGSDEIELAADQVNLITIVGSQDSDALTVDLHSLSQVAITFDAGSDSVDQFDSVVLRADGPGLAEVRHAIGGPESTVQVVSADAQAATAHSLVYQGVESVTDTAQAITRAIELTGGSPSDAAYVADVGTNAWQLEFTGASLGGLPSDRVLAIDAATEHLWIHDARGSSSFLTVNGLAGDSAATSTLETLEISSLGSLELNGDLSAAGTLRFSAADEILVGSEARLTSSSVHLSAHDITHAGSISVGDGIVQLEADGLLQVTGSIDASGHGPGLNGGVVHLLGRHVALLEGALITATGDAGGGKVLVGGDYQGASAAIGNAELTMLAAGARIDASAITSGDGGRVIIWSDVATDFRGQIDARGGSQSGDGGFVEVSGKELLGFHGGVDVAATQGNDGTILLDPRDIDIVSTPLMLPTLPGDPFLISNGEILFDDENNSDFFVTEAVLESLTGNVILQAQQDLTVRAGLAGGLQFNNQTSGESVTFEARRHIVIDSNITTGGGDLILIADANGDGTGTITVNSSLDVGGGTITVNAPEIDFMSGAGSISGANLNVLPGVATTMILGGAEDTVALDFSATDIAALADGFDEIVFGVAGTGGTATIEVGVTGGGGEVSFADAVTLNSAGAGGGISIFEQFDTLAGNDANSITINGTGSTTLLEDDIITLGAAVVINDAVRVDGVRLIQTTGPLDNVNAGLVTISGTIDGNNNGGNDRLTIDAALGAVNGTGDAAVMLVGNVAGGNGANDLEGLTIDGGQIDLASVTIHQGNIDIEGTNIDLNGTTYRTTGGGARSITLDGPVDLHANVTITSAGSETSPIQFTGTINSAGGARTLTVDAGAGVVGFAGAIGAAANGTLTSLTVEGGTIDVANIGTAAQNGVSSATIFVAANPSNTVNLNGTNYRTGGSQSYTGDNLRLAGGATTTFTTSDDAVTFSGAALQLGDGSNLIVNTAGGAISIAEGIDGTSDETVLLNASGGTDNTVRVGQVGTNTANGILSVTLDGSGGVTLDGNITTSDTAVGNLVDVTGPVTLGTNLQVDTSDGNGNVTFRSTVRSDGDGDRSFTVLAGAGDVSLQGDLGGNNLDLAFLRIISANDVSVAGVTTQGRTILNTIDISADGALTLRGDLRTDGGDADVDTGNILLNSNGQILLVAQGASAGSIELRTDSGGSGADGSVTFVGGANVRSAIAHQDGLTINVGSNDVDLSAATLQVLDHLEVSVDDANEVTLAAVSVDDGSGNGGNAIEITAGTINLEGDLTANANSPTGAGAIRLNGNVSLVNDVDILTTGGGGGSDGDVVVTGTINGDTELMINAGVANVELQGAIGATNPLAKFTITNAAQVDLNSVRVASGDIAVTGTDINLNGTSYQISNASGGNDTITFKGAVNVASDAVIAGGGRANDMVRFDGTVDSTGNTAGLTVNGGAAKVQFDGVIGGAAVNSALTELNINAATIEVQNIGTATRDGVSGATAFNATTDVNFMGTNYRTGGSQTYTAAAGNNLNLAASSATTFTTSDDAVSFLVGTVKMANNANLVVNTDGGAIRVEGGIQGTNNETVVLNADGGSTNTVQVGAIGGGAGINVLSVTLMGSGGVTLDGNITTGSFFGGGMPFVDVTGPVTLGGDITIDTGLVLGDVTFSSTVRGAGDRTQSLTIAAGTGNVSIGGEVGGSNLDLSSFTILSANNVSLAGVTTERDPVLVPAPTGTGNIIVTSTGTLTLRGDLRTDGGGANVQTGNILINNTGQVVLDAAGASAGSVLLRTNDGGTGTDGSVTFLGGFSVRSATAFQDGLRINVGNNNVNLTPATLQDLDHLEVLTTPNRTVTLAAVSVDDGSGNSGDAIKITSGTIIVNADLSTNVDTPNGAGAIQLAGDVTLGANTAFGTTGGVTGIDADNTDGDVIVTGTIDGARSLMINAGGANVDLRGDVGSTTPLRAFTIADANQVDLNNVRVSNQSISVTGTNINLNGTSYSIIGAAGVNDTITFDGAVNVTANVVVVGGGNAGDTVAFMGTVNSAGNAGSLTVNAGAGAVRFDDTIGGTSNSALTALNVNAANIDVGNIGSLTQGGVSGVTGLNAMGVINFLGTVYRTNGMQTYTAAAGNNFNIMAGPTTTFTTSNDAVTFQDATIKLANGANLVVNSNGGAISIAEGIDGTSDETVRLNANGGNTNTVRVGQIGTNTANGILSVELSGSEGITLEGDITTSLTSGLANRVDLMGPVILRPVEVGVNDVKINTAAGGGNVMFSETVRGDGDGTRSLTVEAGTGNVSVQGNVGGGGADLSAFTITSANDVTLNDVTTQGGTGTDTIAVTAAGNLMLAGILSTAGGGAPGNINLNLTSPTSDVILTGNTTLLTAGGGGNDGEVNITARQVRSGPPNDFGLTVNVGSNTFDATTTVLLNLDHLEARAMTVILGAISVDDGDGNGGNAIEIVSNTIQLNGDLATNSASAAGAGAVRLVGDVTLVANVTMNTTGGTTGNDGPLKTDGNVTVTGMIDGARTLMIDAGGANVNLGGAIGGTVALTGFAITDADQVDLDSVRVDNARIAVTGTNIDLNGTSYTIINPADGDDTILFDGNVDLHANVAVGGTASTDTITFTGTVRGNTDGTRSLTLTAGSGDVVMQGEVGGANGDLSQFTIVTANNVTLTGVTTQGGGSGTDTILVNATGNLMLAGTLSTAGGGAAGNININLDSLSSDVILTGDTTLLTDGAGTPDGAVTINARQVRSGPPNDFGLTANVGDNTFDVTTTVLTDLDHLEVRATTVILDSTTVDDGSGNGGNAIEIVGTAIQLGGALTTNAAQPDGAGAVRLVGNVTLTGAVAIKTTGGTTGGDGALNDGNVTVIGTVNGAQALSIDAGGADVNLDGAVGGNTALNGFVISDANQVSLDSVRVNNTTIGVTGNTIALRGATYSIINAADGDDTITFSGAVDVNANVAVTGGRNVGDTVRFTGTVDSASGLGQLSVDSGLAATRFEGVIGGTLNSTLAGLDVDAATIDIQDIGTALQDGVSGETDLTAATVNFTGTNYRTGGSQSYTGADGGSFNILRGPTTTFTTSDDEVEFEVATIKLADGANLVVNSNGGAIEVAGIDGTSDETVTLNADGGTTNTVEVGQIGSNTLGGILSVALNGSEGVTLKGDITTSATTGAANRVDVNGPVMLEDDVAVNTGAGGGDVTFSSTVRGDVDGVRAFSITAGTGNVALQGNVGGGAADVASLRIVSAANVDLAGVSTQGGGGTDTIVVTSSGVLTLRGDLRTDGGGANVATGNILLNNTGQVVLDAVGAGSITLRTNDGGNGADGSVTFAGGFSVRSATAFEDGLTVNVGANDVDLSGAVLQELDHLEVVTNGSQTVTVAGISVDDGSGNGGNAVEIRSGGINLTGDIQTRGGDVVLVGEAVRLGGGGAERVINTGGAVANAGEIDLTNAAISTVGTVTHLRLLADGTNTDGEIELGAFLAAGGSTPLDQLTVVGGEISSTGTLAIRAIDFTSSTDMGSSATPLRIASQLLRAVSTGGDVVIQNSSPLDAVVSELRVESGGVAQYRQDGGANVVIMNVQSEDGNIMLANSAGNITIDGVVSATGNGNISSPAMPGDPGIVASGDLRLTPNARIMVNNPQSLIRASAGNQVIFEDGALVSRGESTDDDQVVITDLRPVTTITPNMTPNVDSQGNTEITLTFNPAARNFSVRINWSDGNPDPPTIFDTSDTPVVIVREHEYPDNPNRQDPTAPIPVRVTVVADPEGLIQFLEQGQDIGTSTTSLLLSVPDTGLASAIIDTTFAGFQQARVDTTLAENAPLIDVIATEIVEEPTVSSTATDTAVEFSRHYILKIVIPIDEFGNFREVDAGELEDNVLETPELFRRLPDGRYRVYLVLEDGSVVLVKDISVRQGEVVEIEEEASIDENPSEATGDTVSGQQLAPGLSALEARSATVSLALVTSGRGAARETGGTVAASSVAASPAAASPAGVAVGTAAAGTIAAGMVVGDRELTRRVRRAMQTALRAALPNNSSTGSPRLLSRASRLLRRRVG